MPESTCPKPPAGGREAEPKRTADAPGAESLCPAAPARPLIHTRRLCDACGEPFVIVSVRPPSNRARDYARFCTAHRFRPNRTELPWSPRAAPWIERAT